MNYLAHLYFGRKSEASLVGNLLGDFVKGNEESLRENFPDAVVDGIIMHRKIDRFTDDHRIFAEAKMLFSSHLVRFAGVAIDIFMDHFLAKHWDQYGEGKLEDFVEQCHTILLKHPDWHSEKLEEKLPAIIEHQLLISYREKKGVKNSLERVSQRGKNTAVLAEAYHDFERNYEEFEKIFHDLFPAVKNFAATLAPSAELKDTDSEKMSDDELIMTWRQHAVIMAEKHYMLESLVGLFKSKGVSEEAALLASEIIMAEVAEKRKKGQILLRIPAILLFVLAPCIIFMGYIYPHALTDNFARNFVGGGMAIVMGCIFYSKAKAVR